MRVLGIIPARSGSKGIPGKNTRLLEGKPVLQYTVEAARAARSLDRLILTTDSEQIAQLGRRLGVEVPFLRPPELAADDTPMVPVLQHAVRFLEAEGDGFDAICLLQPTSPLRRAEHIDGCCRLMLETGADSVVTTLPIPPQFNPCWVYFEHDGWLEPVIKSKTVPTRQQLPPSFARDGSVYLAKRGLLMSSNSLFGQRLAGFSVDPATSVNLDAPEDWERACALLRRQQRSM